MSARWTIRPGRASSRGNSGQSRAVGGGDERAGRGRQNLAAGPLTPASGEAQRRGWMPRLTVIDAGRLVDGTGAEPIEAARMIVEGGRIREVETPLDFEDIIAQFIQGKI